MRCQNLCLLKGHRACLPSIRHISMQKIFSIILFICRICRLPQKLKHLSQHRWRNRTPAAVSSNAAFRECLPVSATPVFEKLNANLAKAICSIGAVKGFEIGDGFSAARSQGSVNNDAFTTDAAGHITKTTNHAGGILGGMSDSSEIIFRAAIKPTPSISRTQHTVTREGEPIDIQIKGRHDPIIVPRAVVVVQSMAALVLIDALMQNMTARVDYLRDFYKN